ncbi:MAG: efflux RND transporter permease subunit [Cytophagaceae bacterium]|nr:efflux RND transporter permease subunit [Cytophagaceae bacterium]MDW8455406.1 efflux RND transporter permease subunit [Cytophagaceae bacterium]
MKEFKPSSWAIDNRKTIYVLSVILLIAGYSTYVSLPKEQFPEVVFPQMYITTIYPGRSPVDMENLITKHVEKQAKAISGVKKVTSKSEQNISVVVVEFNTDIDKEVAKRRAKDAADKAKASAEFPKDNKITGPDVTEVDVSQIPIMNINLSGDFELNKLKKYAEMLQDRIESMKEITRVDIVGAEEREIQVNIDKLSMEDKNITMYDITNAIGYENISGAGGELSLGEVKRSIQINGEFKTVSEIENIVIKSGSGAIVYLKDIATVKDTIKEKESYARLNGKNVITLNIIKRSGENLIEASDKINQIISDLKKNVFPDNLNITVTADQSKNTRVTLHDLINTIIIGFILVTVILMFFMGTTNAIFVAMSVPLSMCVAFLLMPTLGFTLNMIVLFSFLLALGIVVDDAIVVIENTHRIFANGKVPIIKAAKQACGEVFVPVLSGTLTTLAPFIPLAFWDGVIGEFMFFLPITLIVTLLASLAVAYIINPVFAVDFMTPHEEGYLDRVRKIDKRFIITSSLFLIVAFTGYVSGKTGVGNFTIAMYVLFAMNKFLFQHWIHAFQTRIWPAFQRGYVLVLKWSLQHPLMVMGITIFLFFFSFFLIYVRSPKVVFFPSSDPNFIYTYIQLPVGTSQTYTDSITRIVEERIYKALHKGYPNGNPIVESIISNVGIGANADNEFSFGTTPHKGKVTVAFVEYAKRNGQSTLQYMDTIRALVKDIPGAQITVEQERAGPPVGKPINIEITGDDFLELITTSEAMIRYLDSLQIEGVEELKSDLVRNKPEIIVRVNREKANREGISTGQIYNEIRGAVFGIEASKFKEANEEYPIQLRYKYEQRNDMEALLNLKITYRDMNMGGILRQVPLSSLADVYPSNTYGGINRKNQKRMITVYSNVLSDYNPNEVVANVQKALNDFPKPESVMIRMTGEQEDQAETSAFLGWAGMAAIMLVFAILVLQFNSLSKPMIILTEIAFSIIGVLLGFAIFKMDVSIVMTGVGMVALAGIVVRNGILLVEFADYRRADGLGLIDAIVDAGRTRMTPVLLTATATILGLIPLAVGLNIDFEKLFTELNPHIFFGGDSVAFWGPLSWTMIFGLAFATFLTLVLVPILYMWSERSKRKSIIVLKHLNLPQGMMYIPFFVMLCQLYLNLAKVKLDYGDLNA